MLFGPFHGCFETFAMFLMKNDKIEGFSAKYETVELTPYNQTMEPLEPLTEFPRPTLVRQTNEHHLLPDAVLAQWYAAETFAEREAILDAHLPERREFVPTDFAQDTEFAFDQDMEVDPATYNPLAYVDPDADDIYDLEFAAY